MPFAARRRFCWKLRSRNLDLGGRTLVMGILNVTPDSFSDGGSFYGIDRAVDRAMEMLDEGAEILDLGGESTRPHAIALSAAEEQERVLPVLDRVMGLVPDAVISIDTYHASTARRAIESGAEIVNDVSGGLWDEAMLSTCAELGCGTILMHTRGRPQEWSALPGLSHEDVLPLVLRELKAREAEALSAGVALQSIALDPGFGFGKLGAENEVLLAEMERLHPLGHPLVAGLSRKGFLARSARSPQAGQICAPSDRLSATIAANTAAILNGAHILRVHDVRPALEAAAVADSLLQDMPAQERSDQGAGSGESVHQWLKPRSL